MRFVTFIMLPVWCALALLGQSGLHALADQLGMCCHVGTSDSAGTDAKDDHSDCVFCLRARASENAGESPGPAKHDASNCRLCDWFLCWNVQSPAGVSVLQFSLLSFQDVCIELTAASGRPITAVSRGPPAVV
jgi:hypothetical protein